MPRSFALIPAAGHSLRMGQPKLLMPVEGRPLILHMLAAWQASKVERVVVVVRPDDEQLADSRQQPPVPKSLYPRLPRPI